MHAYLLFEKKKYRLQAMEKAFVSLLFLNAVSP